MTIALRALGFSSRVSDDQFGVDVPRLSSELPPAELTKLCAGLSRPATSFGLPEPTSGESRPHRSTTEDRLDGMGKSGTGDAIAGRGEVDGIVGEMRLNTGAATSGDAAGDAISSTGDWATLGELMAGEAHSAAGEAEMVGDGTLGLSYWTPGEENADDEAIGEGIRGDCSTSGEVIAGLCC